MRNTNGLSVTGRGLSKLLRLSCGLTISRIMGNNRRRWLRKASNTIEQGLQIQHRLRATQIQKGRGYKYRRPRGTKHLKSKDASCKQNRWAVAKRAVVVKNCAFASLQLADEALVVWWCPGAHSAHGAMVVKGGKIFKVPSKYFHWFNNR